MVKDRRDNKNRILRKGEYQKKDGRYTYRYTDVNGESRYIYSWTLTATDRAPKGKPPGPCLRDLEREIDKALVEEIDAYGSMNHTLDVYFEKYMASKGRLKSTTRRNYRYYYDQYIRDKWGQRRIGEIKYSDVKIFYGKLLDDGKSLSVLKNINVFLNPVFAMAEKDGMTRRNPVNGVLTEIKKELGIEQNKRHALTVQQQSKFIDFVRDHKRYNHWLPLFTFLLGTGCRVGEAAGLTWKDCDFENGIISINHSLSYYPDEYTGKAKWSIHTPKTKAGIREIPMFNDVRIALRNEYVRQMRVGFNKSRIDGYSGFIFTNKDGYAYAPCNINSAINRIVKAYNKQETILAVEEQREPNFLPRFSPHVLRHTFCTRLCENESNLKVIQEVMGHASITITMDIYADATEEKKKLSFEALEGKIKIC